MENLCTFFFVAPAEEAVGLGFTISLSSLRVCLLGVGGPVAHLAS